MTKNMNKVSFSAKFDVWWYTQSHIHKWYENMQKIRLSKIKLRLNFIIDIPFPKYTNKLIVPIVWLGYKYKPNAQDKFKRKYVIILKLSSLHCTSRDPALGVTRIITYSKSTEILFHFISYSQWNKTK